MSSLAKTTTLTATLTAHYYSMVDTLKERGIEVGKKPAPTIKDVLHLRAILQATEGWVQG